MHIVAARPIAMTAPDVPPEIVAKEKEIAVEQAKATGKPQNIAEKIAEGKLNSFYAERVLLDQEYINAEVFKGSVANYLKSKRRDAGEICPHRSRAVNSTVISSEPARPRAGFAQLNRSFPTTANSYP